MRSRCASTMLCSLATTASLCSRKLATSGHSLARKQMDYGALEMRPHAPIDADRTLPPPSASA